MSNEKDKPISNTGNNESRVRFDGEVLIEIRADRGVPTEYRKGYLAVTKAQFVSLAFKTLFEANKDNFEEALAPHFTEAGKAHFATAEGKEELAKFIEFVKNKKSMPQPKK